MATSQRQKKTKPAKKYFTVEQANKMLPLVRAVLQDIVPLAEDLLERQERLNRLRPNGRVQVSEAHREEYYDMQQEFARDAARLEEFMDELRQLGVELKGLDGIVDFPGLKEGREVCLCWKLGEPEVAHWHEVDAGFAGRQPLTPDLFSPAPANHNGA
jgi:hypothetical protein